MTLNMENNAVKGAVYGAISSVIIIAITATQMGQFSGKEGILEHIMLMAVMPGYLILTTLGYRVSDYGGIAEALGVSILFWTLIGATIGYLYDRLR